MPRRDSQSMRITRKRPVPRGSVRNLHWPQLFVGIFYTAEADATARSRR